LKPETVGRWAEPDGESPVGQLTSPAPPFTNDVDLYPDMIKKWGLSFPDHTRQDAGGRSAGSLAWAASQHLLLDSIVARRLRVLLTQLLPFADQHPWKPFAGFERGVYADLDAGSDRSGLRVGH